MWTKGREKPLRIVVGNEELENVNQFRYIGRLVGKDANCIVETRSRVAVVKNDKATDINDKAN